MEGFLIRLPSVHGAEISSSRLCGNKRVITSRVLYYVLGEGYLRGYRSPDDTEPIESFELTQHRLEVDVMYSMMVFQLFARPFANRSMPPVIEVAAAAATLDADSESESGDDTEDDEEEGDAGDNTCTDESAPFNQSSLVSISGNYSVVFFAASKHLVQKWSVKILNWNRYVFFQSPRDEDGENAESFAETLQLEYECVVQAFRATCVGEMCSPRVRLQELQAPSPQPSDGSQSVSTASENCSVQPPEVRPTIDLVIDKLEESRLAVADKLESELLAEPTRPWWTMTKTMSRRISSHSLRK